MKLDEEILNIETADGTMAVIRKRPTAADAPSIVMFHDGPGVRTATHDFASKLARSGYDVIVPDLYYRHGRMIGYELEEREQDPSLVDHLRQLLATLNDVDIQNDLDAALFGTGLDSSSRLGTIGFCVGARAAHRTMARMPERFLVGAMWHPSFLVDDEPDSPHHSAADVPGSLFIGIGGEDTMQPVSFHQPFLDAIAHQPNKHVHMYDGAGHGYTWRGWPSYHPTAATHSFDTTIQLFREILQEHDHT